MMSPDPPPEKILPPTLPPSNALEGSQSSSLYQSRVRALLGLPGSRAVPLVSSTSSPMLELPYVAAQAAAARQASDLWGSSQQVEPESDRSIEDEPIHQPFDNRRSSSSLDEEIGTVTDHPNPETNTTQESLKMMSANSEDSLSVLKASSQTTSIRIPGITPLRSPGPSLSPLPSSPLPSLTSPDTSTVEDEDLDRQTTLDSLIEDGQASPPSLPSHQAAVSPSELSSAVLTSNSMAVPQTHAASPLLDQSVENNPDRPSYDRPLNVIQKKGNSSLVERPTPEMKEVRDPLVALSPASENRFPENPLPESEAMLQRASQPTSNSISEMRQPRSDSPPLSMGTDTPKKADENSGKQAMIASQVEGMQPILPSRQIAAVSSESSPAVLADGSMTAAQIDVRSLLDRAAENEADSQSVDDRLLSSSSAERSRTVTHYLAPETNRTQESLEMMSAHPRNSLSALKASPQATSVRIPGVTQTRSSSSLSSSPLSSSPLSSSASPDFSTVEDEELDRPSTLASLMDKGQATLPSRQTAVSPSESSSAALGSSPTEAAIRSDAISVMPDPAMPESLLAVVGELGHPTDLSLATSSASESPLSAGASSDPSVANRNPEVDLVFSGPSARSVLGRKSWVQQAIIPVGVPVPERLPEREVAWDRAEVKQRMVAQIEKLEQTVADLSAQVARQKDFQQSVPSVLPQPVQPQVVIQKTATPPEAPRAFWERRYASRLYRWSRG